MLWEVIDLKLDLVVHAVLLGAQHHVHPTCSCCLGCALPRPQLQGWGMNRAKDQFLPCLCLVQKHTNQQQESSLCLCCAGMHENRQQQAAGSKHVRCNSAWLDQPGIAPPHILTAAAMAAARAAASLAVLGSNMNWCGAVVGAIGGLGGAGACA